MVKNRIAAVLSLTGVLVAGSAAALVNTQVLKGAGASAPKTPTIAGQAATFGATVIDDNIAVLPGASAASVPGGEATESTVLDTSVPASTAPPAPPAASSAAAGTGASDTSTQVEYTVGSAGVVTLDTVGDRLTIIDATPASGWKLVKAEQEDPHAVDVRFRSATTEVTFRAHLLFGVISTSVAAANLDSNGSPVATAPGAPSGTTSGTTPTVPHGDDGGSGSSHHDDDKGGDSGHDDQHNGGESDD